MAELERLLVRIDASTEMLRKELKRADDDVGKFSSKIDRSTSRINSLFANMGLKFAAAFSGVKITQFVRDAIEAADRIADLSKRTGIAAETLQRLQFIAAQSGTDIDALAKAWNRYSVNLAGAEQGTKSAQQRFNQLGLNFKELRDLSPEDQLLAIADSIASLGAQSDRTKALVDLFGKSGAELAPVFNDGADALRRMFDEQGKVLSNEQIEKIDEFNDRWNVMKLNLQALAAEGFVDLLDAIRNIREELGLFSDDLSGMSEKALRKAAENAKSSIDLLTQQQQALSKKDNFLPIDIFRDREKSLAEVNKQLQEAIDRYTGLNIELSKFEKKQEEIEKPKKTGGGGKLGGAPDTAVEKQKQYREELQRSVEQMKKLAAANDNSTESYEALKIEIDAHNEALKEGFAVGTPFFNQIKAEIVAREQLEQGIKKVTDAREEEVRAAEEAAKEVKREQERQAERLAEEFRQPFETAAENIQNLFMDTFEGIFEGSIDSAADAADAMKRIFIRLAAEMASLAIFRPQVLAAGGVGGLAGGIFSGGSSASGGGGLPFGSDTILSKGVGLTGIGSGLDALGASVAPSIFADTAAAATAANVVGPVTAAQAGAAAAIPFSAIALPVAAIVATALISGVFKKSRPHPASTFSFGGVGDNGKLQDLDIRAKHIGEETARGFSDAISQSLTALQQIGLKFGGLAPVQGGVDDGRGFLKIGDKTIGFNPQDEDDAQRAVSELLLTITQSADNAAEVFSEEARTALQNIETQGRDLQAVMSDIAFTAGFDALLKMPEELSQVEQAVKDLETAFDGIRATADRLGLSLDKVNAAEQARLDKLRSQFTGDLTLSLLEGMAPNIRQLAEEEKRFLGQLRDAAALGLGQDTIARINALHQKNVELLTQGAAETQDMAQNARDMVSRFGSVSDKFKKLLFDLQFGQLSPLNPRQRLDALRGQVGDLGRRARLGDVDAADELAEVLPEFVQLSAEFNGFNKNFESDRAMAEDLARATKSVADRQLEIQKRILDETSQQTDLLAEMLGGGSGKGNANDKIYSLVQSGQLSTESAHAIIRAAGYTGPIGGGKVQAAFDADPAMNQQAWKLLKAAGFASGGMVTGGITGMDSVPAMLSPGEVVMRARAVQAIGANTLLAANQTGRLANDNNKGVEQLLGRLINVTQSLVNVTAASGNQTVAGLHGVQAELSDISNKARLEAAK